MIELYIPGAPRGKGRPRACRVGSGVRLYTDAKTRAYEDEIKQIYKETYPNRVPLSRTPVAITVTAVYPITTSMTKTEKRSAMVGELQPTKKPDIDNIVKSVLDGLQGEGGYIEDDRQVVEINAKKEYESAGKPAGVYVTGKSLKSKIEN